MNSRSYALAFGACASLLLGGCGGGGGATPAAPAQHLTGGSGKAATPASGARASATITIPAKLTATAQARARRTLWVSPSTAAVQFYVTRTDGYDEVINDPVGPSVAGCAANGNGALTCVVPFSAPPTAAGQTDDIQVYLMDNIEPGLAQNLGFAELAGETVTSGAANAFAFVVGGIAVNWYQPLLATPANPTVSGTASSQQIAIQTTDADDNLISGPIDGGLLVTLSSNADFSFAAPTQGASLSADGLTLTVTDPSLYPNVVLNYNGTGTAPVTLTASTNSIESASMSNTGNQMTNVWTLTPNVP